MPSIRSSPSARRPKRPPAPTPWPRVIIGLVVFIAALYGYAWWRADQAVGAGLERWEQWVVIERGITVLEPNGSLVVRDLSIYPRGADPARAPKLVARNARLSLGGPFAALGTLLFGQETSIWSPLAIDLEHARLIPAADSGPNALIDDYVVAPFDLAGCGEARWTGSTRSGVGIGDEASDVAIRVEREGDNATARFRITSHGLADLLVELRLDALPPASLATALRSARLRGARIEVTDYGFQIARNRWCAEQIKVSEDAFAERHVAAVRDWFGERFAEPAVPMLAVYREFATKGGAIEVNLRPRRPLALADFRTMALRDFSTFFGGTARIEGQVPATLAIAPLALPSIVDPVATADASLTSVSAAAELSERARAATAAAAGDTAPAKVEVRRSPGQTLAFPDLEQLVGASVAVTTRLGVERRGRIVRYTNAGIELELDAGSGGFVLSVPRDAARRIVLLQNPPVVDAEAN